MQKYSTIKEPELLFELFQNILDSTAGEHDIWKTEELFLRFLKTIENAGMHKDRRTLLAEQIQIYLENNLEHPITFAQLLERIEQIEGLERIRFMTSHPKDLSDELIEVMGKSKKICKHLHLPVQSGSSKILKKMNRHYTKEQYLELVEKIRRSVPDISLTTDIIVGFPGETEEDFEETMKKCIHISLADYKKLKLATRIEGKVLRLIAPLM